MTQGFANNGGWGSNQQQQGGFGQNEQQTTQPQVDDGCMEWDATIENDSSFVTLPAGVYPCTIKSVERGRYQAHANSKIPNGCWQAKVTVVIDGGPLGQCETTENLFLHRSTEGILCSFFRSIGHRKSGEPLQIDWARVPNEKGYVRTIVREHNGNTYTRVKDWIDEAEFNQAKQAASGGGGFGS